jgi:hypothetical protein
MVIEVIQQLNMDGILPILIHKNLLMDLLDQILLTHHQEVQLLLCKRNTDIIINTIIKLRILVTMES